MRPVGSIFTLKTSIEDLERELVPSFDLVLDSWVSDVGRTSFADPEYVTEVTYITAPLKALIERIVERLDTLGLVGGPLERSFGFGKTHALIVLWHLFTSDMHRRLGIRIPERVLRETLVLAFDYSSTRVKPFVRVVEELMKYADLQHPIAQMKDPTLIRAINEVLRRYGEQRLYTLSGREVAELIAEILEKYRELGGTSRLLLLVDELGYGLASRAREFVERASKGDAEADKVYIEANEVINFLSYLYANLHNRYVCAVIVWAMAEQDRKEIVTLGLKHQDEPRIYNKVNGLIRDLDLIAERYSRGLAGTSLVELAYSSEHALEIARYRVLKLLKGVNLDEVREEYVTWLFAIAKQLNLGDLVLRYRGELKSYYPFSIGLIHLLKKLINPRDVPGTEFVRTVILIAARAANNALRRYPDSYCIGVEHLTLGDTALTSLLSAYREDWDQTVRDIEDAIKKIEQENIRLVAEFIAKYLLAKGVTASPTVLLLESTDRRDIERYGTSLEELQVELLQIYREDIAIKYIELLSEALEKLRAGSARIDEREVDGRRLYIPTILKTLYDRLSAFISEEKKKVENPVHIPLYIRESRTIPSLFSNLAVEVKGCEKGIDIVFASYNEVRELDSMVSKIREPQNRGSLALLVAYPWDAELFNEMYLRQRSYNEVVNEVTGILQRGVSNGSIRRPLHVVVLLPNLSSYVLKEVINELTEYEGTKRFCDYLLKEEKVLEERVEEFENIVTKRGYLTLQDVTIRQKHLQELRRKLMRDIEEARSIALKQIIRLSRELVKDVLGLYSKVIYFSSDKHSFTAIDISGYDIGSADTQIYAQAELSQYASMINKYFKDIINILAFSTDVMRIVNSILDFYKRAFESGQLKEIESLELSIDDVVENVIQGTYGVKPLCQNVANLAVGLLNNQTIDLVDKVVRFTVDRRGGKVILEVKRKVVEPAVIVTAKEEVGLGLEERVQPPAEVYVEDVTLEVLPEVKPEVQLDPLEDLRKRLVALFDVVSGENSSINSLEVKFDSNNLALTALLRKPKPETLNDSLVRGVVNLLIRIALRLRGPVSISIHLVSPVRESKIKEVLAGYYKPKRSSFDKYLE